MQNPENDQIWLDLFIREKVSIVWGFSTSLDFVCEYVSMYFTLFKPAVILESLRVL